MDNSDFAKRKKWALYLAYLINWADRHSCDEHYGMTPTCFDEWVDDEYAEGILLPDGSHMCCHHDKPIFATWCEENCARYYSCDTIAQADDEAKVLEYLTDSQ